MHKLKKNKILIKFKWFGGIIIKMGTWIEFIEGTNYFLLKGNHGGIKTGS